MSKKTKKPHIKYDAKRVTTDSVVDWYVEHHFGNKSEVWKKTMKDKMKKTYELNESHYQKLGGDKARKLAVADAKRAAEKVLDPKGFELKRAKQEANINTPSFSKLSELNKKIDKKGFNMASKYLGRDDNNMNVELLGYYDIKNSNLVLAQVATENPYSRSPIVSWQFVDKAVV